MKLSLVNTDDFILESLICDGYGRTLSYNYQNWKVDPSPKILKLGKWVHPNTGNTLIAGINLNYLTPDQVERLREELPNILANRHLKARYWKGVQLIPDVFRNFYRTYNANFIDVVDPGTLKFKKPGGPETPPTTPTPTPKPTKPQAPKAPVKPEAPKTPVAPEQVPQGIETPPEKEPVNPVKAVQDQAKKDVRAKIANKGKPGPTPKLPEKPAPTPKATPDEVADLSRDLTKKTSANSVDKAVKKAVEKEPEKIAPKIAKALKPEPKKSVVAKLGDKIGQALKNAAKKITPKAKQAKATPEKVADAVTKAVKEKPESFSTRIGNALKKLVGKAPEAPKAPKATPISKPKPVPIPKPVPKPAPAPKKPIKPIKPKAKPPETPENPNE